MDPLFWDALFLSLRVAALASGILLLAGAPLAWLLAFRRFPGKALLEAVFLLPLVLPPTVLGFYLLLFLGPEDVDRIYEIIKQQRSIFLTRLARVTRRRRRLEKAGVSMRATEMILDGAEMRVRADLAWLESIERRLIRQA